MITDNKPYRFAGEVALLLGDWCKNRPPERRQPMDISLVIVEQRRVMDFLERIKIK